MTYCEQVAPRSSTFQRKLYVTNARYKNSACYVVFDERRFRRRLVGTQRIPYSIAVDDFSAGYRLLRYMSRQINTGGLATAFYVRLC